MKAGLLFIRDSAKQPLGWAASTPRHCHLGLAERTPQSHARIYLVMTNSIVAFLKHDPAVALLEGHHHGTLHLNGPELKNFHIHHML